MKIYASQSMQGFPNDEVFGARTILVPDPDWVPSEEGSDVPVPLVEVPNPACRLPADAVEIPYRVYRDLLTAEASGQVLDWSTPVPTAVPATPRSIVPRAVSKRQGCLALLALGKLDEVEQLVADAPRAVQVTWQTMQTFERDNPLILSLAPQLQLDEAALDALFVEAASL